MYQQALTKSWCISWLSYSNLTTCHDGHLSPKCKKDTDNTSSTYRLLVNEATSQNLRPTANQCQTTYLHKIVNTSLFGRIHQDSCNLDNHSFNFILTFISKSLSVGLVMRCLPINRCFYL